MFRMTRATRLLSTALLCLALPAAVLAADDEAASDNIVRYSLDSDFDSARDALEFAITNQGLVITSESHIDEMLERTGADLGQDTKVYEHAVAFEFCSAKYSRLMMETDPHNIVFCPFVISVYSLPGEPDKSYIAYRKPQTTDAEGAAKEALDQVSGFLDAIATAALE